MSIDKFTYSSRTYLSSVKPKICHKCLRMQLVIGIKYLNVKKNIRVTTCHYSSQLIGFHFYSWKNKISLKQHGSETHKS